MKKLVILVNFCLLLSAVAFGQQTDFEKLQASVDTKEFVFEGRQASAMRGRMIQLDPGYTLEVSPDQVVGNLPFFGRAYQSTPGTTEGGLKFEFTDFEYKIKPRKKGGWDVTIEPKESSDVRVIYLTIQTKGNASLRITSNSKDPMSYSGFIKE